MGQDIPAGKFIPENHVIDSIIDVTLPFFRSYGMASEELYQEAGWIKYTVPQEQDVDQDQQGQQHLSLWYHGVVVSLSSLSSSSSSSLLSSINQDIEVVFHLPKY